MYLFFRRKFSWDNKGFGAYIGLFGLLGIFAQYGLLPFMSNRLKFHDLTIGMPTISETSLAQYYCLLALIAIIGVVIQQTVICFTPAFIWLGFLQFSAFASPQFSDHSSQRLTKDIKFYKLFNAIIISV